MDSPTPDALMWDLRLFVYEFIAAHERPPVIAEAAAQFGITEARAEQIYRDLDARHAIFLEPGQLTIRMAHPFSGVPTSFAVRANGHRYYANCAWDSLGIPAMLSSDATVETRYSDTNEPIALTIHDDRVSGADPLIHFPLPFKRWYDNLVFT
jgi:hypothetical protein